MRIETPAPVRKPVPLVPLVDVVFLLLMYFMLSTTFTKFGEMAMAHRAAAQEGAVPATSQPGPPGVIIRIAGGPGISINGEKVALEDVETIANRYFQQGARSGAVIVQPSAQVQDLVSVLERLKHSSLRAVSVVR